MVNPKVSVIIPVYNCQDYLRETLESVINQNFKDIEIIIINDCSTDSSLEIIKSFDDKRIRYHANEVNFGIAKTVNVGLRMAKGEFIARLDADDVCTQHRFQTQIEYLLKNPHVDVLGSSFYYIDRSSRIVNEMISMKLDYHTSPLILARKCIFGHSTVMFRRRIVDENNFYDEAFSVAEDYEMWVRLVKKYNIVSIPDKLIFYRVHNQSALQKFNQRSIDLMFVSLKRHNQLNIQLREKDKVIELFKHPFKVSSPEELALAINTWLEICHEYKKKSKDASKLAYEYLIVVSAYYFFKKKRIYPSFFIKAFREFPLSLYVIRGIIAQFYFYISYFTVKRWYYKFFNYHAADLLVGD